MVGGKLRVYTVKLITNQNLTMQSFLFFSDTGELQFACFVHDGFVVGVTAIGLVWTRPVANHELAWAVDEFRRVLGRIFGSLGFGGDAVTKGTGGESAGFS